MLTKTHFVVEATAALIKALVDRSLQDFRKPEIEGNVQSRTLLSILLLLFCRSDKFFASFYFFVVWPLVENFSGGEPCPTRSPHVAVLAAGAGRVLNYSYYRYCPIGSPNTARISMAPLSMPAALVVEHEK